MRHVTRWILVLVLLAPAACGWMDALKQPAEDFLRLAAAGDMDAAYRLTSVAFRKQTSQDQLRDFLDGSGLSDYASASWQSFSVKNDTGQLEGTVTTREGGTIPLTVFFVREQEAWRIQRIELKEAGLADASDTNQHPEKPGLPPEDQWTDMARDAIVMLGEAVNGDDWSGFLAGISPMWRSQVTEDDLRSAFSQFKEQGIDLTRVRDVTPSFDGPAELDENGLMTLTGTFPTDPYQVHFELTFHVDDGTWRLFGVSVNAR